MQLLLFLVVMHLQIICQGLTKAALAVTPENSRATSRPCGTSAMRRLSTRYVLALSKMNVKSPLWAVEQLRMETQSLSQAESERHSSGM